MASMLQETQQIQCRDVDKPLESLAACSCDIPCEKQVRTKRLQGFVLYGRIFCLNLPKIQYFCQPNAQNESYKVESCGQILRQPNTPLYIPACRKRPFTLTTQLIMSLETRVTAAMIELPPITPEQLRLFKNHTASLPDDLKSIAPILEIITTHYSEDLAPRPVIVSIFIQIN